VFSPGKLNSVPNALFREYCESFHENSLYTAQASLCHPGITRLCHFVCTKNLPYSLDQWFLTGEGGREGISKFSEGREPLHCLQHGEFLNGNVYLLKFTQALILLFYLLFGLVPAKMEVGVKFLEILLTDFESLYKYRRGATRGVRLVGISCPLSNNICAVLTFENSILHIECQGSRLHRRAPRLIPDKHECTHFAQFHAA